MYFFIRKLIPQSLIFYIKRLFYNRNFSLNDLRYSLSHYINYRDGFYVELGANDGITQSNTFHLEKNFGWRGVLIEPTQKRFNQCKKIRSSKNNFYNNTCVSFNYKEKTIKMFYSDLTTKVFDENDNHSNRNEKKHLDIYDKTFSFDSEVMTLNDILIDAKAPNLIDFISLDVEGYEEEVLKGLDHKKFRFKYLLIESKNETRLKKLMNKLNYIFEKKLTYHDYLFKNK